MFWLETFFFSETLQVKISKTMLAVAKVMPINEEVFLLTKVDVDPELTVDRSSLATHSDSIIHLLSFTGKPHIIDLALKSLQIICPFLSVC